MAKVTRREILAGSAAMVAAGVTPLGLKAQQVNGPVVHGPQPATPPLNKNPVNADQAGGDLAGGSKVFAVDAIAGAKLANGAERKIVFDGRLATGEAISAHESMAPARTPAAPAHKIAHSEFIVVMEGTMEFVHDGKSSRAKAGDVIYVAYGTNHQVRNAGEGVARYLVFQVAGDTK